MASFQSSREPTPAQTPAQGSRDGSEGPASAEASREGSPEASPMKQGTATPAGSPAPGLPAAAAAYTSYGAGDMSGGAAKRAAPVRKRAGGGAQLRAKKSKAESGMPADPDNSFKGIFSKDLPSVMYGFGDSSLDPVPESVEALEAIATEYVKDILTKAQHHSTGKPKIDLDDLMFVIRKDVRKVQRANELLKASEMLKEAKRATDPSGKMDVDDLKNLAGQHGVA